MKVIAYYEDKVFGKAAENINLNAGIKESELKLTDFMNSENVDNVKKHAENG